LTLPQRLEGRQIGDSFSWNGLRGRLTILC
jgi:hypothetical protein